MYPYFFQIHIAMVKMVDAEQGAELELGGAASFFFRKRLCGS